MTAAPAAASAAVSVFYHMYNRSRQRCRYQYQNYHSRNIHKPLTAFIRYIRLPAKYTIHAHIHAITHWHITTPVAHFEPSSLLIDVMAATHGV